MKVRTAYNDVIVVDTQTGELFEVLPVPGGYRCEGLTCPVTLELDYGSYQRHFTCGLFQYCNYG